MIAYLASISLRRFTSECDAGRITWTFVSLTDTCGMTLWLSSSPAVYCYKSNTSTFQSRSVGGLRRLALSFVQRFCTSIERLTTSVPARMVVKVTNRQNTLAVSNFRGKAFHNRASNDRNWCVFRFSYSTKGRRQTVCDIRLYTMTPECIIRA